MASRLVAEYDFGHPRECMGIRNRSCGAAKSGAIVALDDGELDTVDFVRDIEATLGIQLEDAVCERVCTVKNFYELLKAKLSDAKSGPCLTQVTFYQVRRALRIELGCNSGVLRPHTALETVLPVGCRRRSWQRLETALDTKLPALTRPIAVRVATGLIAVAAAVVGGILSWQLDDYGHLFAVFAALAATFAAWLTHRASRPLARVLPRACTTLGDLARCVRDQDFGSIAARAGVCSNRDLWEILQLKIGKHFGVDPVRVAQSTRFVGTAEEMWM
jgi:hypothetical protein